jgi:hypothetical protein
MVTDRLTCTTSHDFGDVLELSRDFGQASGFWGPALPLITGLAVGCGAKQLLEVGVGRGGSTHALLAAAESTDGRLISIDSADCLGAIPPDRRDRWTFLCGESFEVLPILRGPIDFALIDGDHSYQSTLNELCEMERLLAPGGLVMLDDVWEPEYRGCLQAFSEFDSSRIESKQLVRCGVSQSVFGRARTFGLIRFRE